MKPDTVDEGNIKRNRRIKVVSVIFLAVALIFYVFGNFGMGNFIVTSAILHIVYRLWVTKWIKSFQSKAWPKAKRGYERILRWSLDRPWTVMSSTLLLFILAIGLLIVRSPGSRFFPEGEPNFIYVYILYTVN